MSMEEFTEYQQKTDDLVNEVKDYINKMGKTEDGKYLLHKESMGLSTLSNEDLFLMLSALFCFFYETQDLNKSVSYLLGLICSELNNRGSEKPFLENIKEIKEKVIKDRMDVKTWEELTDEQKEIFKKLEEVDNESNS